MANRELHLKMLDRKGEIDDFFHKDSMLKRLHKTLEMKGFRTMTIGADILKNKDENLQNNFHWLLEGELPTLSINSHGTSSLSKNDIRTPNGVGRMMSKYLKGTKTFPSELKILFSQCEMGMKAIQELDKTLSENGMKNYRIVASPFAIAQDLTGLKAFDKKNVDHPLYETDSQKVDIFGFRN